MTHATWIVRNSRSPVSRRQSATLRAFTALPRAKSTGYLAAFRAIVRSSARPMSIPHTNANSSSRIITSAASTATAIAKFVGS